MGEIHRYKEKWMLILYLVSLLTSKAFTSASLAILVDEGKIKWDDKVIKYLPNFKMYNDCNTHRVYS
jgi:hypothetical protein